MAPSTNVRPHVELPPFAVMLAPPAAMPADDPPDLAVGQPRPETIKQAGSPPDLRPEVVITSHGTIAPTRPVPPGPVASIATASPSIAAAAPPPQVAPASQQSSAPIEGASDKVADALPNWEALVRARLERAKRYPAGARIMKQQDTVVLQFDVDGGGRVSGARIRRSAGYEELENEALSLIARVSPLPPPPNGTAIRSSVPVEFYLNR